MNFTFHNPLALFGLTAVILPILIHRITHKKAVVRRFSAVRLLLESQLITARPQRLKNLLLLALRILAVATVVFMMARPLLVRPGYASLPRGGAMVLIMDNSLSMQYQEEIGRRFDIAKRAAREALEGFDGQVALIATASGRRDQALRWMSSEEALRELEAMPLSFGRSNTESAVASAYRQLSELQVPKQIMILSDLARSDWEGLDLSRLGTISDTDLVFFRIGGPGRDPNFRIKDVGLPEGEMVAGAPARLEVTVSNLSDHPGSTLVQILLSGEKVDQKGIELEPGQEAKLTFDLLVQDPGWIDGEVKLSSDRLSGDDTFYLALKVASRVRVLVVDGDPTASLKTGESYYLLSALRPGDLGGSPFLTRVIVENELAKVDLSAYDALFMLNVARPDFSRLASFLEMGKPAFVFLGDRIVTEAYNAFPLAPWQIRERTDPPDDSPESIVRIDPAGGAFGFLAPLEDSLKSAVFRTYFQVEGTARHLLTLRNQSPLLLEAEAGKSKLILFVSSADLDWNDLALKAAYVPLIQGLVKDAVGLTGSSYPRSVTVGEPFAEEGRPSQLRGPEGGPGVFQFLLPAGERRRAVNTPPEESDLTKLETTEIKKKFGAVKVAVMDYDDKGLKELQGGPKEIWPLLLWLLFVVLAVERLLANGLPRFSGLLPRSPAPR